MTQIKSDRNRTENMSSFKTSEFSLKTHSNFLKYLDVCEYSVHKITGQYPLSSASSFILQAETQDLYQGLE
jgi:hypothetical protein